MRVLVYANVGLNLIDGSTVWVQSLAEVLSALPGCDVTVLSRDALKETGVALSLAKSPDIRLIAATDHPELVDPWPSPGDPRAIAQVITHLDKDARFDRVILRAPDVARVLMRVPGMRRRVWAYLLESPELSSDADRHEIGDLVRQAGGLIVQSEAQRGLLEAVFPEACNKTSVLPPMVKPITARPAPLQAQDATVRFIYSGKYSATWNVEAFFDVPQACQAAGISAEVTMIGDKVHNEKSDPGFRARILRKFQETPGINWLGPMERDEAIAHAASHDLGLCWRTDALDDSLEISTKFLEFASQGVPSVVNHTAAYEALLGEDYPYFATDIADVVKAAGLVTANPGAHAELRLKMREMAQDFGYEAASERLRDALHVRPGTDKPEAAAPIRVLIASHDLKFLNLALERLAENEHFELLQDHWKATKAHDVEASLRLRDKADVIFCEWCAGNAGWYSHNKLPHQKLYIRLHRFEAFTEMPRAVDIKAVDGIIVVSDHLRDHCMRTFGWPAEKFVILPQYCDAAQFNRYKHPGSETTLGLVGINSFLKRPDRAIEILRAVRARRPEFQLRIRSAMPWDIAWLWGQPEEKSRYLAFFSALEADADLRAAVIFDRPGADMAEWFRNIGYILSVSDIEGCHTAVAEGICSGAEPVVINWDGARSIYGAAVHDSIEEMAEAILKRASLPMERPAREQMRHEGRALFDISRTLDQLETWFKQARPE